MVELLRPRWGGFLKPFGCGEFIRRFLLGEGPEGSPRIDPGVGAPIEDIRSAYKNTLLKSHAEDMVALAMEKGIQLSTEEALRRIPHRLTKMRSRSFYRYFPLLKQLGWVEATGEEKGSLMGATPGAKVERTPEGNTLVKCLSPGVSTGSLTGVGRLLRLPGAILSGLYTATPGRPAARGSHTLALAASPAQPEPVLSHRHGVP